MEDEEIAVCSEHGEAWNENGCPVYGCYANAIGCTYDATNETTYDCGCQGCRH